MNDGTGDQASNINSFFAKAQTAGQIAYLPTGIHQVDSTICLAVGFDIQCICIRIL
jgi:hypothetical protein